MGSACTTIAKFLLFIFNLIFWASGVIIVVIGIVYRLELGKYGGVLEDSAVFTAGCILLIGVGCVVTQISFFGCCGAIRESYCMIVSFIVLLVFVFVLELAAGITCYVYQGHIDQYARNQFNSSWASYMPGTQMGRVIDNIQQDLHCCGVNNYTDWPEFEWGRKPGNQVSVPFSCCMNMTDGCGGNAITNPAGIYKVGCYGGLKDILKGSIAVVGAVGVGVAFIQLLGILLAICFGSAIRNNAAVKDEAA